MAGYQSEFSRFNHHCRHLKRILKETDSCLLELCKHNTYFDDQVRHLYPTILEKVSTTLHLAPTIIVLGQDCYSKSTVVNEIFGKQVLPTVEESDTQSWRTVRFSYGLTNQISLSLPNSYELWEQLDGYDQNNQVEWRTIPHADLEIRHNPETDITHESTVLEIKLRHALLKERNQLILTATEAEEVFTTSLEGYLENALPIFVYAIVEETLSLKNIEELKTVKGLAPNSPIFFVKVKPQLNSDLTESEQHAQQQKLLAQKKSSECKSNPGSRRNSINNNVDSKSGGEKPVKTESPTLQQLVALGYINNTEQDKFVQQQPSKKNRRTFAFCSLGQSELLENFEQFGSISRFLRRVFQATVVECCNSLIQMQEQCLNSVIEAAFDMARDAMITPRRIHYAKQQETELFESLMELANRKQDEMCDLIVDTVSRMREELLQSAADYQFQSLSVPPDGRLTCPRDIQRCTDEIQDYVLTTLNAAVADKLINSVNCLRECVIGTLERCLHRLESSCMDGDTAPQASLNLKQILNAAYQVEVTVKTSASFIRILWEKMKQLVQTLPWTTTPRIDSAWKRKVANDMIESMSTWRLAKNICSQFQDRLKLSHEAFASNLRTIENLHYGRLEKSEEQKMKVRKVHAPTLARCALESISLRDLVLNGMPQLGREIGRGQYGVVFSSESWAGFQPVALKSVVPPDDKHWNDLALEFHYTRCIPEHPRIVTLHGSVIDYNYGGGSQPAVLLIMERLTKDLHSAIRCGMEWLCRLQVSLDVVQGIRYLHSQGLVHRDIKLKNVLLDRRNRAKLTDLGFCKPEAMMSGSVVGTPIHMAPELFSGKYDSSVDVYAFGILFWYICAGHVRLPYVYEQCQNKDQLWTAVRRGARPERLPQFDEDCWTLMESCWHGDPNHRPLLGHVEPKLIALMDKYRSHPPPNFELNQTELGLAGLSTSPYIDVNFHCPM